MEEKLKTLGNKLSKLLGNTRILLDDIDNKGYCVGYLVYDTCMDYLIYKDDKFIKGPSGVLDYGADRIVNSEKKLFEIIDYILDDRVRYFTYDLKPFPEFMINKEVLVTMLLEYTVDKDEIELNPLIIEKEVTTRYIHKIKIGKTDFAFKYLEKRSKKAVLNDVANQLVYIDRDVKSREILFYKQANSVGRGSGYMDFYFEFPEDDFTKDIDINKYNDNNKEQQKLFYILLEHFNQN